MRRNDPEDSRTYNYVYKIKNNINGMIYIGVHRTDDINDGYMGSGTLMKRAIAKHGVENFSKEIIAMYNTYKEALDYEGKIVTEEFINREDTYNIKIGGYGPCIFSAQHRENLSNTRKKRFKEDKDFYNKYLKVAQDPERRRKIGERHRKWIQENPSAHYERMLKINTNPDKIAKTAKWHKGRKRNSTACENIRRGQIEAISRMSCEQKEKRSGKGCVYYHNPNTGERKRYNKTDVIPQGWKPGTGARKKKHG